MLHLGRPDGLSRAGGFALGFWGRTVTTMLLYPFFHVQTKVRLQSAAFAAPSSSRELPHGHLQFPIGQAQVAYNFQQVQTGNTGEDGVWGTLAKIARAKGVAGLYRGVVPELVRGGLYQCVVTGTKDMLLAGNVRLLMGLIWLVSRRK